MYYISDLFYHCFDVQFMSTIVNKSWFRTIVYHLIDLIQAFLVIVVHVSAASSLTKSILMLSLIAVPDIWSSNEAATAAVGYPKRRLRSEAAMCGNRYYLVA